MRQLAAAFEMRLLKKRQLAAALQSAFGAEFKKYDTSFKRSDDLLEGRPRNPAISAQADESAGALSRTPEH